LAETKKPIIIVSQEDTFHNALETYQYLADHENVELAFNPTETTTKIQAIKTSRLLQTTKVCLFDAGEWKLEGIPWQKNPLFSNRLNVENVNIQKFLEHVRTADPKKAEALAKRWMKNKVLEPSLADVTKTARIYLGIKKTLQEMKAKAVYVLWCGQFTKKLQAKMCFALAKLADDGYPTGCWRGENLLPMLILHSVSKKPIFTAEALTHKGGTITLRHCFAPTRLTQGKYVLRRWRNVEGTVTAYCQLPKGEVTLINCGIGDRIVVARGKIVGCKDLGGDNCRMTVWVRMEKPELTAKFAAREFAMVYGNYEDEVTRTAERSGFKVLR
jgi:L-fucose isomerase-like protein